MTQFTPDQIKARFGIAQDGTRPAASQLAAQATIRDYIALAGVAINAQAADGREKALALTSLEEALMWAGKAVFSGPTPEAAPESALDTLALPIEQDDLPAASAPTVGAYLAEILITLLREGAGFSGKRPLGNSDWDYSIDEALKDLDLSERDTREALYNDIRGALS